MAGFQLWVNLPARLKMTTPRYQEVPSVEVPEVVREDGGRVRVIAGTVQGVDGAVGELAVDPTYLDVALPADATFVQPIERGHTAFAYIFEGGGWFGVTGPNPGQRVPAARLVVLADGDQVTIHASAAGVRFLLVSGRPLHEPIARYGPFVMNTPQEIQQALLDLRDGTFVR
jgi:redox-sensitive bicupin YhaK (pirin superfamily)